MQKPLSQSLLSGVLGRQRVRVAAIALDLRRDVTGLDDVLAAGREPRHQQAAGRGDRPDPE
jgi:hypothetical protein